MAADLFRSGGGPQRVCRRPSGLAGQHRGERLESAAASRACFLKTISTHGAAFTLPSSFSSARHTIFCIAARRWTSCQRNEGALALLANVELGAVCLVAALIAPLFAERELRQSILSLMGLAIPEEGVRPELPVGMMQFRIVYVAVVIACGIAWYLVRRKTFDDERRTGTPSDGDPNLERLACLFGHTGGPRPCRC